MPRSISLASQPGASLAGRSTERQGGHQAIGSGLQPTGQTSWLGPVAQVGGVQPLLPASVGMHCTEHSIASGGGAPVPPQLSAAAVAPTTVNASTAGMRSAMATP